MDLTFWLALLILVGAGALVTRFNPLVAYRRGALIGLAAAVIVLVGAAIALGFLGAPAAQQPSGVLGP
jgi:hypothetical protein